MVVEFQAVVLAAGLSSPLDDLIEKPKPLLQVGGLPLIFYPLQFLKNHGFDKAIVVVSESTRNDIFSVLTPYFENSLGLEFVTIPDDDEDGTAESLRLLHSKKLIQHDMLIMGCDLITDICLHEIANVFRKHDASLTVVYQKPLGSDVPIPGTKSKRQHDRDIVGVDTTTNRLLFTTSEADIEDELHVNRGLLMRYPRMMLKTTLQDAHFYLMKNWVLDVLVKFPKISSIRSELVPFLLKHQHGSKSHMIKKGPPAELVPPSAGDSTTSTLDIISKEGLLQLAARKLSVWTDHSGDMTQPYFSNSIRCYGFFVDKGFCFRVNSIAAYCEANHQVPRLREVSKLTLEDFIHPSVDIQGKSQIGPDSIVGERTVIQDKVSIKRSVIGRNCRIDEKAKISGCILMDDVEVGESCNLQNCLVASEARLGEKCDLKDCLVGQGIEVGSGMKHISASLTLAERAVDIAGFV